MSSGDDRIRRVSKLLLYISLIACVFAPWQIAVFGTGPLAYAIGAGAYVVKPRRRLPARVVRRPPPRR
jgi:hypothetical protein